MAKHWVGCSGFHYKHWKEIFYPNGNNPRLKQLKKQIKEDKKAKESFLYFNNDINGSAIKNAKQMKKIMVGTTGG